MLSRAMEIYLFYFAADSFRESNYQNQLRLFIRHDKFFLVSPPLNIGSRCRHAYVYWQCSLLIEPCNVDSTWNIGSTVANVLKRPYGGMEVTRWSDPIRNDPSMFYLCRLLTFERDLNALGVNLAVKVAPFNIKDLESELVQTPHYQARILPKSPFGESRGRLPWFDYKIDRNNIGYESVETNLSACKHSYVNWKTSNFVDISLCLAVCASVIDVSKLSININMLQFRRHSALELFVCILHNFFSIAPAYLVWTFLIPLFLAQKSNSTVSELHLSWRTRPYSFNYCLTENRAQKFESCRKQLMSLQNPLPVTQ